MNSLQYLKQIDINITDLCNKTCSFCPRHDSALYPNNNQHMSLDLFKKVIDECLEVRYSKDILLCGRGESSLHKNYEEVLELLHHPDRTWKTCLTTNGRKLEKYWDYYTNNFDFIILNTYTNKEEYDERVKKYGWKLNTSGKLGDSPVKIYNLEHYFKPTGATIDQVNNSEKGFERGFSLPASPGIRWKYNFNKRCGLDGTITENPAIKSPCLHPLELLFLNFDGKMHMCCNDWGTGGGKGQTVVGDFTKNNVFEQYLESRKRDMIIRSLINGRRHDIEACKKCEVKNRTEIKRAVKIKNEQKEEYMY